MSGMPFSLKIGQLELGDLEKLCKEVRISAESCKLGDLISEKE